MGEAEDRIAAVVPSPQLVCARCQYTMTGLQQTRPCPECGCTTRIKARPRVNRARVLSLVGLTMGPPATAALAAFIFVLVDSPPGVALFMVLTITISCIGVPLGMGAAAIFRVNEAPWTILSCLGAGFASQLVASLGMMDDPGDYGYPITIVILGTGIGVAAYVAAMMVCFSVRRTASHWAGRHHCGE